MKNDYKKGTFTLDEVIYYNFYRKIEKQLKDKEDLLTGFNELLDDILMKYKFPVSFFDEVKEFYYNYKNDERFRFKAKHLADIYNRKHGRRYDKKIGMICYDYFVNKNDYFEPNIDSTYDDIVSFIENQRIHLYRRKLKPSTFLAILINNSYNNGCQIILEDNESDFKCDSIFVGYTDDDTKIDYFDYPFLEKYNYITPANIDKESFDLAFGLERLSDNGILIYNTHAISMYKNDPKTISFRKYLIDNKMLKAIIFTKSFTRKTDYEVFYIITKEPNDSVVFIDAGSNKYRKFYELAEYSDAYEFGEDFLILSHIVKNKTNSYGISEVVSNEQIIENDYRFDIDDYIIVDKESKFRSLEEIEEDIRVVYGFIGDNLF